MVGKSLFSLRRAIHSRRDGDSGLPAARLPTPIAVLVTILGLGACAPREDQAFREHVPAILKDVPLGSQLDVPYLGKPSLIGHSAAESDRDSLVATYERQVLALPHPRDKQLRYLAIRLESLGGLAGEIVSTSAWAAGWESEALGETGESKDYFDRRASEFRANAAEYRKRYHHAVGLLAASEHVALGTNILHDRLAAEQLMNAPDSSRFLFEALDSLEVAWEHIVRRELEHLK